MQLTDWINNGNVTFQNYKTTLYTGTFIVMSPLSRTTKPGKTARASYVLDDSWIIHAAKKKKLRRVWRYQRGNQNP